MTHENSPNNLLNSILKCVRRYVQIKGLWHNAQKCMNIYISIIQHHTKCSLCNVKENKSGLKDKQKILHNHYMLTTIKKFKHGITNY